MPEIKVKNEKSRVLKPDEEMLVFAAIDKRIVDEPSRQWRRFHMLVRVLLDTGFRRDEALILGPDSVIHMQLDGEAVPFIGLP